MQVRPLSYRGSVLAGKRFADFPLDPDVVAHEYTHGVTQHTSNLRYESESGAMNEAMSDIFGACVDRQEGASIENTWILADQVLTPNQQGDGLRYLANPKLAGSSYVDFYPERYTGTSGAGIYWNSGIMSLAFVLMVQGGMHPRAKSNVNVPPIDADFDASLIKAAKIFYFANTACLTPLSTFHHARECTSLFAGPYLDSVEAAWDAVGVAALTHVQVIQSWRDYNESVTFGSADSKLTRYFRLSQLVNKGEQVTCMATSDNMIIETELLVGFGDVLSFTELGCEDASLVDSRSECTTSAAPRTTRAFLTLTLTSPGDESAANVDIMCGVTPLVETISNRHSKTIDQGTIGSTTGLREFRLGKALRGEYAKCKIEGGSGDAALLMKIGSPAYPLSSRLECYSHDGGSEDECRTRVLKQDRTIFVAIHAQSEYQGISITCSRESGGCVYRGERCTNRKDCCGSRFTCDGTRPGKKTCRRALLDGGACRRNTQCARGSSCRNGKCEKKR